MGLHQPLGNRQLKPGRCCPTSGITAVHAMLVHDPNLVRLRLKLAHTFFLKGKDGLARNISRRPWPAIARRGQG
ncbi:MAG: hypothetical protein OXQ84_12105 [bacterium]|nr:hypothetical protein [bacterium]